MAEKKTFQRLGIERLIEGGDLPIAAGPVMLDVPTPTAPTPALTVPGPRVSVCQALGMGRVVGGVGALVRPLHWSDLARRVVLAALPSGPRTAAA